MDAGGEHARGCGCGRGRGAPGTTWELAHWLMTATVLLHLRPRRHFGPGIYAELFRTTQADSVLRATMLLSAAVQRRRLRGKQPAPPAAAAAADASAAQAALDALRQEAWAELRFLAPDAQRQHVHWTHVRTHDPADKQPDTFTRKEFYEHLERCTRTLTPSQRTRAVRSCSPEQWRKSGTATRRPRSTTMLRLTARSGTIGRRSARCRTRSMASAPTPPHTMGTTRCTSTSPRPAVLGPHKGSIRY